MQVLFIMLEVVIIAPLLALLSINIVKHQKRKKLQSNSSLISQKEVHDDMDSFAFQNQGHSLNSCKIYKIPYSNIGYSED